MKTKTYLQLLGGVVVLLILWYLGSLINPAIKPFIPILANTFGWASIVFIFIVVAAFLGMTSLTFLFFLQKIRLMKKEERFTLLQVSENNSYAAIYDTRRNMLIQPTNGEIPVRVSTVPNSYSYAPHYAISQEKVLGNQLLLEEGIMNSLPDAPPFADVLPYIKQNKNTSKKSEDMVVLGYDGDGPIVGKILDLLSTLVVGMPGLGKSTAIYFFIAQLIILKSKFQVLDPHASLIALKDFLPYVHRIDRCIQMSSRIEKELEDRMERYEQNGGKCLDDHYMLIVDEIPAIASRENDLKQSKNKEERNFRSLIDIIKRIVCEGRKYNMYCMVVGQSIPATVLPTIARDNMSTRYVFSCSESHARMAGLDRIDIEEKLPLLKKQIGKCIIAPSRMETRIGAIPLTSLEDLEDLIIETGFERNGYDWIDEDDENIVESFPDDQKNMEDPEYLFSQIPELELPPVRQMNPVPDWKQVASDFKKSGENPSRKNIKERYKIRENQARKIWKQIQEAQKYSVGG